MVRYLLIIFGLLCGHLLSAQHITFQGFQVDGEPYKFARKLCYYNDFHHLKRRGGYLVMNGKFVGENAEVVLPRKSPLRYVEVRVRQTDDWYALCSSYYYFTKLYQEKYGSPFYIDERDNSPSIKGSMNSFIKLKNGEITKIRSYNAKYGWISVSIVPFGFGGYVSIQYCDGVNFKLYYESIREGI